MERNIEGALQAQNSAPAPPSLSPDGYEDAPDIVRVAEDGCELSHAQDQDRHVAGRLVARKSTMICPRFWPAPIFRVIHATHGSGGLKLVSARNDLGAALLPKATADLAPVYAAAVCSSANAAGRVGGQAGKTGRQQQW